MTVALLFTRNAHDVVSADKNIIAGDGKRYPGVTQSRHDEPVRGPGMAN
jgi:hypothetical protein